MSDKKRKRQSEKGERPVKKVAIDGQAPTVKLSFAEDNDILGPVIASTPGLSLPLNFPLIPYKKGGRDDRILPPGNTGKSTPYELLLQSSAHSKLDYTAREEHDGSADSLLKHYVGIYNPSSGELELMEAHKVTVRTTLRSELEDLRVAREQAAIAQRTTMTSKRHALGMEFGTKKSRKAIEDVTVNAITPRGGRVASPGGTIPPPASNTIAASILKSMAASIADMPTPKNLQTAADDSKPRPKANLDAKAPEEVYPIATLIGNEIMSAINVKDWIDAVAEKKDVRLHSRFVAKRLESVAQSGDVKRLKVLRYILLLINFNSALKTGHKGVKRVPPKEKLQDTMGFGGPLLDSIRRKFAPAGSEMTRWHVDNLMTHVAAAALIVDNYEVDVNDLREDLRLVNKEIKQYFSELGCKINPPTETERSKLKITKAESINHQIAKLRLPLNFPKQRVMRTKGGR
ncbi:DNA-directed RNA polymeras-like protein I 49 kDa polypeptide [Lepidopterella palustris CBS 459.81]|uniref:DNA-directed RNA polymeras-like protein I 49 kDa polypeptide n=1 Tax=Lepidopterella palustris CBS 459.81 TaxID=1314670 RepID=A0A8E2E7N3_9PEZI|nr:DNA-directed RNA polymeras-like protein I 49 kDa polypeptide [Lepidopterella palustris CBS 459.81]